MGEKKVVISYQMCVTIMKTILGLKKVNLHPNVDSLLKQGKLVSLRLCDW